MPSSLFLKACSMTLEDAVRRIFDHVDQNDVAAANRLFEDTLAKARRGVIRRRRQSWHLLMPAVLVLAGALFLI